MTTALAVIAVLLLVAVIFLRKFMRDMASVESELIREIREMKEVLKKINEKQL